jgi:molybdopterin biosynthesis enzyme
MIGADGLAIVPTEVERLRAGDEVEVELLGWGSPPRRL